MTQREQNQRLLEGFDWRADTTAKTRKYVVMVKEGVPFNYYLGRAGAVRRGTTIAGSVPVSLKRAVAAVNAAAS